MRDYLYESSERAPRFPNVRDKLIISSSSFQNISIYCKSCGNWELLHNNVCVYQVEVGGVVNMRLPSHSMPNSHHFITCESKTQQKHYDFD